MKDDRAGPARHRACIEQVRAHVSERRACAALGQHRSTQRKVPRGRDDEQRLTATAWSLSGALTGAGPWWEGSRNPTPQLCIICSVGPHIDEIELHALDLLTLT